MNSLDRLRGGFQPAPLDARRIAATLEQPGCTRRTTLDAAQVPLDKLARLLGAPQARQSPFAITRGNQFERKVMDNGMAELLRVAREVLGLPLTSVRQIDLSAEQVAATIGRSRSQVGPIRLRLTRERLAEMLRGDPGAASLLRHPLLAIPVAGVEQRVEADVLALVSEGALYVIEIKSFQALDGRPNERKVAETALQSAVYVLALQDLVMSLGFSPTIVVQRVLLILPRNFSFTPVGFSLDVRARVNRLRRQLAALPSAVAIADGLDPMVALPTMPGSKATVDEVAAARTEASRAVSAIAPVFGDGCTSCPLFRYCRDEARSSGAVAAVGSAVAADCGDLGSVDEVLDLARGNRAPGSILEEAVAATYSRALRAVAALE